MDFYLYICLTKKALAHGREDYCFYCRGRQIFAFEVNRLRLFFFFQQKYTNNLELICWLGSEFIVVDIQYCVISFANYMQIKIELKQNRQKKTINGHENAGWWYQ